MPRTKIVVDNEGRFIGLRINCPGCGDKHVMPVRPIPDGYIESPHYAKGPHWDWNGSLEWPTFAPSLSVKSGHYCYPEDQQAAKIEKGCWCNFMERFPDAERVPHSSCYRCHSFIKEGRIQFLDDCTHKLKGQTVDLPQID